jgi:LysM repeat protein
MGVQRIVTVILLLVFASFPPSSAFAENSYAGRQQMYVVGWGDTLGSIAERHQIAQSELAEANNIRADGSIFAGQTLLIPRRSASIERAVVQTVSHTVTAGETLYRIAVNYGTTVDALLNANPDLTPQTLQAGQTISIPSTSATPPDGSQYVVQAGDTLASISQAFNVSTQDLVNANSLLNASVIYAGQSLVIPGAASSSTPAYTPREAAGTYTVQPGDTLLRIANRFGVSSYTLAQANNISSSSWLYAGQVLTVPGSGDEVSQAAPPTPSSSTKRIIVDVSDQRTYAYESGTLVRTYVSSTGLPGLDTWRGEFEIQNKIPMAYASTWNLQMPYWMGFYWAGPLQNGFHALPILPDGSILWAGHLGTPVSYGCVILSLEDMRELYNWTEVGTPVTVRN